MIAMNLAILHILFVIFFSVLAYLLFDKETMLSCVISLFLLFLNLYFAIIRIEKMFCK